MKTLASLFLLLVIFPFSVSYATDDDFRIYKKPLLPSIDIAQTDTHTELLYKGGIIKRYVNAEYPTELLPHGPDENPDCYNSLNKHVPSDRAKNLIGKDYLRSCLVLETRMIGARYILFYAPSVEGNRVSLYDIRKKKFLHGLVNNVSETKSVLGGVVFLTKQVGDICDRKIWMYKNETLSPIFDTCSLASAGISLLQIQRIQTSLRKITIHYTPYFTDSAGNIVLDTKHPSQKIINLSIGKIKP